MHSSVVRYSDAELQEFHILVQKKLDKAKRQLEDLVDQILEITENADSDYGTDYFDDSSTHSNLEMLNNMAIHQRKYIRELENALLRIQNKTYGICMVSGELIDKRRLMAVPTTTKSLHAKNGQLPKAEPVPDLSEEEMEAQPKPAVKRAPQIITKVIRRSSQTPKVSAPKDDEEFYIDEDLFIDDNDNDEDDLSLEGLEDLIEDESQNIDF